MILPDEERYDERHYLRDAARAQKEYWIDQKAQYLPDLGKHPDVSKWEEIRLFVWFFCVAIVFIGVCAVIAFMPHHIQIIQPHVPRKFPTFTTSP